MMSNTAINTRKFRARRHFFGTGQAMGAQRGLLGGDGAGFELRLEAGLVQTRRDGRRDIESGRWERQGARLNQPCDGSNGKWGHSGVMSGVICLRQV